MNDPVLIARDGHVALLTLNRPETRNAISDLEMIDALCGALSGCDADPQVRAVVLTGAGPAFSAGGNLKKMGMPGELGGGTPVETMRGYRDGIQRIPRLMRDLAVPVIAAVNGPAVGAGCDLACMCDIRIAGESASFAESFVRMGLIPGDGGAWLLQRVIGYARAAELSLTGDSIDAAEALRLGLVSRVTGDAELVATALSLARRIAANPPHAVRLTKRLMVQARDVPLDSLLELSAAMQSAVHLTTDHREAVAAFREKRAPRFTGD